MSLLPAGSLDRRITIERATTTRGPSGGTVQSWATLAEVWAQLAQTTGREFLAAQRDVAEERTVFRIRWRDDVTTAMRVRYGALAYQIHDVRELGRKEGLELHTSTTESG